MENTTYAYLAIIRFEKYDPDNDHAYIVMAHDETEAYTTLVEYIAREHTLLSLKKASNYVYEVY